MDAEGFTAVRRSRKRRPASAASCPYTAAPPGTESSVAGDECMEENVSFRTVSKSELDAEAAAAGEELAAEVPEAAVPSKRKAFLRDQILKDQKDDPFIRRLPVPPHRYTPLKQQWVELIRPLILHMKLQVRMNLKRRCVELRAAPASASSSVAAASPSPGGGFLTGSDNTRLEKGADYIRAFLLGFEQRDCIAILRLEDMYLESIEIHDVKRLHGAHLSRCIGRLTGRNGSTKFAIENSTRTRVVVAGNKIHILGSFDCIKLARHSICSLILGQPQSKVYSHLRTVAKRLAQRV